MERRQVRLSGGTEVSVLMAGDRAAPAVLLLHGFPSSANTFRAIVPALAQVARVIAPDLPGYGASEPLASPSFAALTHAIGEVLAALEVGPRHLYLHDYGAPVGLGLALRQPALVRGLIVQNANAHRSGFGPAWAQTLDYYLRPTPDNEAAATAHLTAAGVRDQYVAGVPEEIAARIPPAVWEEDWRVMQLPGRMATQRALVADYARHIDRFPAIAAYLGERQPPALLLWGRHDAFFDLAETLSWMQALPRMEAHILDGGHFLLETHAAPAGALLAEFVRRTG